MPVHPHTAGFHYLSLLQMPKHPDLSGLHNPFWDSKFRQEKQNHMNNFSLHRQPERKRKRELSIRLQTGLAGFEQADIARVTFPTLWVDFCLIAVRVLLASVVADFLVIRSLSHIIIIIIIIIIMMCVIVTVSFSEIVGFSQLVYKDKWLDLISRQIYILVFVS